MNSKNKTKIRVNDLDLYYGEKQALKGINMDIRYRIKKRYSFDWTIRMWKINIFKMFK